MAFRGADPHNLRRLASKSVQGPLIETDRECGGCGYNLRGLRLGVNCPECGLCSSTIYSQIDDPLSLMPLRVIFAFIRGCWVASICMIGMLVTVLLEQLEVWDAMAAAVSFSALATLWCGAVIWLTPAFTIPQAVIRGFSQRGRVRRTSRWLQFGWVIAAGSMLAETAIANPRPGIASVIGLGQWAGVAIGMIGLVMLCILLERLAEWTRDDDAQRMFNLSMWGMPIATLALLIDFTVPLAGMIVLGFWVLSVCTFPYGLLSLSKSVTLTILHSIEHRERTERKHERDEQFMTEAAKRAKRAGQLQSRK
jgi:hypothetical protein